MGIGGEDMVTTVDACPIEFDPLGPEFLADPYPVLAAAQFSWGRPTQDEQLAIARNMVSYWQYCERFIDERLAAPRGDFASDLVRIHLADPEQLTRDEIIGVVYGLSFAGRETTTNLTSNAMRRLLENRVQWEAICPDPTFIPNAVEEVLRFGTSVIAWRRITTRAVAIGGVQAPAGARLLLSLAAANHDPARFAEPDSFDIRRENAREHLAFGKGIHFCLGAPLARIELRTVLELLCPALRTSIWCRVRSSRSRRT